MVTHQLIPILTIAGLVLLSFFGAAAMSHEMGGMGCLASDLLAIPCPVGGGVVGEALFHAGLFLSIFQLNLVKVFLLAVLLLIVWNIELLALSLSTVWSRFINVPIFIHLDTNRWLTALLHSPTS